MHMIKLLLVALTFTVVGCAPEQDSKTAAAEVASRDLQPADGQLAEIYNRSCRSCHTVAATGSPLTGDATAWQPRMDKGIDALLDSVINGFGGMPPFGLCMDCSAEEFKALILFMAGEQG